MGSDRPDLPLFSLEVIAGDDGWTTVSAGGELDLASAGEFSRAVQTGLAAGAVFIDLRRISFMDSAGVRALDTAIREAAEHGRELRMSKELQPSVVRILELTGILGLLPLQEDG